MLCESSIVTGADIAAVLPIEQAAQVPAQTQKYDSPALSVLEKRQIMEVLSRAKSRKEAAELLGISKSTLWRKCKEFGLE